MKIYNQYSTNDDSANESGQDYVDAVSDNLSQLIYSLKSNAKSRKEKRQFLYQRPWYLLLGPSNAGKSTLLRDSDVHFSHVLSQENNIAHSWVSDQAVYIDIDGEIIQDKDNLSTWMNIYSEFKSVRPKAPLNGIIFVVNLHDLVEQSKLPREAQMNDYLTAIHHFTQSCKKPLPIYIVFTHMDMISGFAPFFDHLSQTERAQSCGFMLPSTLAKDNFTHYISQKYDQLLSVFNQSLIKRLHQVQNKPKKAMINEFPLQMENIKDILIDTLKLFNSAPNAKTTYLTRGIYFCSSQQSGVPADRLSKSIAQTFSMKLPVPMDQIIENRAYFVHDLFKKIIARDYKYSDIGFKTQKQRFVKRSLAYTGVTAAAAFSFLILTKVFMYDVSVINVAGNSLTKYHSLKKTAHTSNNATKDFENLFAATSILFEAQYELKQSNFSWLNLFPLNQIRDIRQELQQTYYEALKDELLPKLGQHIATELSKAAMSDPKQVYATLKAYLMLGYPQHMQADYFKTWLLRSWKNDNNITPGEFAALSRHLNVLLKQPLPGIDLDIDLIRETRASLNNLPRSFIAYLTLRNSSRHENIIIKNTESLFRYHNQVVSIPFIYTKKGFFEIYDKEVNDIAKSSMQGDWVLGRQTIIDAQGENADVIVHSLRRLYITDYINWWNAFLKQVQVKSIVNIQDASDIFDALADNNSPFDQLIRAIHNNTSASSGRSVSTEVFNRQVASQFYNLDILSNETLSNIKSAFKGLSQQFKDMQRAYNSDQRAFIYTQALFGVRNQQQPFMKVVNQIQKLPYPISNWIGTNVQSAWQLMSHKAMNHINQQWTAIVLPEYKANISGKYPLDSDSELEIDLKQFSHFFSPKGTLTHYFSQYIAPFIDLNDPAWKSKNINGFELSFNSKVMEQFIRANLMRKMFFPDNNSLNISFTLTPILFEPIVKDMILNINGHKVLNYQGSHKVSQFEWPGANPGQGVEIVIETVNGLASKVTESGPWALFKVLKKAHITPLKDMKHFELIFALDDSATKYELIADAPINPFVPGVVDQFKLPDTIKG